MVKKIEILESKMQDLEEELVRKEEVRKATALLQTEHTALMASKVKLEAQMKELLAEIEQKKKDVESYVMSEKAKADKVLEQANEQTKKTQVFEARVEVMQSAVNRKKAELRGLEQELSAQRTANEKEASRLEQLGQDLGKNLQGVVTQKEEIAQLQAELETGQARQAEQEQDLRSQESALKREQSALKAGQEDLEIQQAKIGQLKQSVSVAQARVREAEKKVAGEALATEQAKKQNDLDRQVLEKKQGQVQQDRATLTKEQEQLVVQKRGLEAASLELRISESKVKEKLNLLKLKKKGIYGVSK